MGRVARSLMVVCAVLVTAVVFLSPPPSAFADPPPVSAEPGSAGSAVITGPIGQEASALA